MRKRIEGLERTLNRLNTPTQEKLVCRYLQLAFRKDVTIEELDASHEKVKDNVVRLH